jgi:adenosine deaminase
MKRTLLALLLLATPALAQSAAPSSNEQMTAALVERLKADPVALRLLLTEMPKGGDLHNHLDGSVWAEDFLKWADADGACLDAKTHAIAPGPCRDGQVAARGLMGRDPKFYQASIDALSMRNFVAGLGTGEVNGHDHTFATFPRFGALVSPHLGEALAVTRQQAAADRVQYMEQITDPAGAFSPALLGAVKNFSTGDFNANLAQVTPLLPGLVTAARAEYDAAESRMRAELGCGTATAKPGCKVEVRYLFFVLRTLPPNQVFAQTALGYALAAADPRFVGVNLVAPEDDAIALRDFSLHMRMFQYFRGKDPRVKLALHAGEVWLGLVPPSELGFHIRDTVEIAGASRIGHGYALPFERDAKSLLARMAKDGIAIEINLTSNAITPGVSGAEHPMRSYMRAGVPYTLSADDEGVFRIDLTHEYVRAAREQRLTYGELKTAARNGITYSFLPGASLWEPGPGFRRVAACRGEGPACESFLKISSKAALQAQLEREFFAFEAKAATGGFPN